MFGDVDPIQNAPIPNLTHLDVTIANERKVALSSTGLIHPFRFKCHAYHDEGPWTGKAAWRFPGSARKFQLRRYGYSAYIRPSCEWSTSYDDIQISYITLLT